MKPKQQQESSLYYEKLSAENLAEFAQFCCGDGKWACDLNDFLRDDALKQQRSRFNTTYVFYYGEHGQPPRPVAFVALSASEVRKGDSLLRRAPYPSIPALLIGRLAVDEREQGKGLGSEIMGWIRNTARSLPIGCRFLALHVDQENEAAIRFYRREDFIEPPDVDVGHGMQLMLYDLIESEGAGDGKRSDPA